MAAEDFAGKDVGAIVRAFTSGKARARDIVDGVLDRCARAAPFNPIATLDSENVRAAADALDSRRKAGGALGSLAAVPVSAKDLILTKNLRTAFASLTMKDNVPAEDASAIAQWRAADALLFAKTTTPEFGHKVLTDSRLHGVTRNPWNKEHTSGGSSGARRSPSLWGWGRSPCRPTARGRAASLPRAAASTG